MPIVYGKPTDFLTAEPVIDARSSSYKLHIYIRCGCIDLWWLFTGTVRVHKAVQALHHKRDLLPGHQKSHEICNKICHMT